MEKAKRGPRTKGLLYKRTPDGEIVLVDGGGSNEGEGPLFGGVEGGSVASSSGAGNGNGNGNGKKGGKVGGKDKQPQPQVAHAPPPVVIRVSLAEALAGSLAAVSVK